MADNPFLLPDGTVDILAVTNRSKRHNTPIEGELISKDPCTGLLEDFGKVVERDLTQRLTPIEGEVITPADEAKERSDNAAMIVEVGLAVLATGNYVALPPIWDGSDVEKEVKDITALQIEKKD